MPGDLIWLPTKLLAENKFCGDKQNRYNIFPGYVDTMKTLLFTLPKSEMKKALDKYSAKVPEPLNRQFPERKSKENAVKDYKARKKMTRTSLFPSGKLFCLTSQILCCNYY